MLHNIGTSSRGIPVCWKHLWHFPEHSLTQQPRPWCEWHSIRNRSAVSLNPPFAACSTTKFFVSIKPAKTWAEKLAHSTTNNQHYGYQLYQRWRLLSWRCAQRSCRLGDIHSEPAGNVWWRRLCPSIQTPQDGCRYSQLRRVHSQL